jgi:hypothetical protein
MQEHLGLCLLAGGTAVIPEVLPLFPDTHLHDILLADQPQHQHHQPQHPLRGILS